MTTKHKLHLNSPWFEYVKAGKKIYEGRRNIHKIRSIQIGDTIEIFHFTDTSEPSYTVTVEDILYFPTFEHALNELPIDLVLPSPWTSYTIAEGVDIYKRYVSLPTQIKDGVVILKLKRVSQ